MIAIKGLKMQTDCKKCPLMGTDGNPKDPLSPMMCVLIWAITHEIKHCVGGKILDDCPLVEIKERKVGKWIVHDYAEIRDGLIIPNYECTCCHDWVENDSDYCPNCGAEMRGAENG